MPDAPLILVLALDPAVQEAFDALRRRHFPPERNLLAAHVTAFHALPAQDADRLLADVQASAPPAAAPVAVTGVRFLGRGVAIDLRAPDVEAVRADLARRWQPRLTAQDRQRWRPHVTVQNKVHPDVARVLHQQLAAGFVPFHTVAVGWELYRYLGGPWEHLRSVPFGG